VTVKKFDATSHAFLHDLPLLRFSQGDRAGALRAYSHGRAVLADQLQVEPEPETVALAKRIRHTSPVRSTSFGSFFAPHTSPGQPPTNLLNGAFLARTAEFSNLIECYQRVAAGQPEFVLLKGETGIGKTHLARAFAGWAQVQRADVLVGAALPLSRVGFVETCCSVRRDEGGREWLEGPLWSPAVPFRPMMWPHLKNLPMKAGEEWCERPLDACRGRGG
jgi:AAA ATPase domain/Bacterial transcriptional activator domain